MFTKALLTILTIDVLIMSLFYIRSKINSRKKLRVRPYKKYIAYDDCDFINAQMELEKRQGCFEMN